MTVIWYIYWPLFVAALLAGIVVGRIAYRLPKVSDEADEQAKTATEKRYRRKRNKTLWLGLLALLTGVALWHGPLGGGSRFAELVEGAVAKELDWLEVPGITGKLERSPLSRTLVLTGEANDFQQDGFIRALRPIKGISKIRWEGRLASGLSLPLLAEVSLLSLIAFVLGLFFSFIVEIRRRVNAEWSW